MNSTLNSSAAFAFPIEVERFYASLISAGNESLGGKLLYVGELDADARALLVAANIAGAASLAATADLIAQRQAIRDGVVDFLVTSLDEAVRILKNEIRKRETVAVCVAARPETLTSEMRDWGVVPDLWRPAELDSTGQGQTLLAWSVASSPAIWLPKLDAIALDCMEAATDAPGSGADSLASARRWLRLAPRYLGRMAKGVRVLRCGEQVAAGFRRQIQERMESGEIPVAIELQSFSSAAASIRAQSSLTP